MKKSFILAIAVLSVLLCHSCDSNDFYVFPPDELGMAEYQAIEVFLRLC